MGLFKSFLWNVLFLVSEFQSSEFLCSISYSDNNDDTRWSTELDHDELYIVVFPCALSRRRCGATPPLPSPWPSPQGDKLCSSLPVVDLKRVVTQVKGADPCSWKPPLGRQLVICSWIFQALCVLCSWAMPFFLVPLKPKAPFPTWSVPSSVSWQVVWLVGPVHFEADFLPSLSLQALLEKLLLLINLIEGQTHSWPLMIYSIWSVLYWLVLVISGLKRVTPIWLTNVLGCKFSFSTLALLCSVIFDGWMCMLSIAYFLEAQPRKAVSATLSGNVAGYLHFQS